MRRPIEFSAGHGDAVDRLDAGGGMVVKPPQAETNPAQRRAVDRGRIVSSEAGELLRGWLCATVPRFRQARYGLSEVAARQRRRWFIKSLMCQFPDMRENVASREVVGLRF